MKKQNFLKLLTLVFTLTILITMSLNAYALTNNRMRAATNVPDTAIDRRDATSDNRTDTGTISEESKEKETGVLDEALTKAEDVLDDVTGALNDAKDEVENAIDDADNANGFLGVVIAILIAVAIIILIIVMVSKNTEKNNRK